MTARPGDIVIQRGLPAEFVTDAVRLYWQAFGEKLGPVLRPEEAALDLLRRCARTDHAIAAIANPGGLVGVAGFKAAGRAFIDASFGDLRRVYCLAGALWRAPLLQLLERPSEDGVLLMDGICVAAGARGKGVGSRLLEAILSEAAKRSMHSVRLDVIDTNIRAKALYERLGFRPVSRHDLGPLRWLFGFEAAFEYRKAVDQISPGSA